MKQRTCKKCGNNELARAAGATKDLPIYEPQQGTWTQLMDAQLTKSWGGVSIWRYER